MNIYLNTLPATLTNAKRIMDEQDSLIQKIQVTGTILHRGYDDKSEMWVFTFISENQSDESSPSFSFTADEDANTIEWIHTAKDNTLIVSGSGVEVIFQKKF